MLEQDHQEHVAVWDYCLIGNGVSALWALALLKKQGRSVLWVTSDSPMTASRAVMKSGWLWTLDQEKAQKLVELVLSESPTFDGVKPLYFDARSSKRYRNVDGAKIDWGRHEVSTLESLITHVNQASSAVDISPIHSLILSELGIELSEESTGPLRVLSESPRIVQAQSSLLVEMKITSGAKPQVDSLEFALGAKPGSPAEKMSVKADHFILGDFEDHFSTLVTDKDQAALLAAPWRGRALLPGFGLKFEHQAPVDGDTSWLETLQLIPLIANPAKKGAGSHIVGRFWKESRGEATYWESSWFGFLTEEELEDNNEILKKMKASRRVLERTIPGFEGSVISETMSFEPQMCAIGDISKRTKLALGALVISDAYGAEGCLSYLQNIAKELENGKAHENAQLRRTQGAARGADRETHGVGL